MKTPENQATYRTPNGAMKQLDSILVDKKAHMLQQRRGGKRHDPHR